MGDARWDLLLSFLAGVASVAGLAYWFWRQYGNMAE